MKLWWSKGGQTDEKRLVFRSLHLILFWVFLPQRCFKCLDQYLFYWILQTNTTHAQEICTFLDIVLLLWWDTVRVIQLNIQERKSELGYIDNILGPPFFVTWVGIVMGQYLLSKFLVLERFIEIWSSLTRLGSPLRLYPKVNSVSYLNA